MIDLENLDFDSNLNEVEAPSFEQKQQPIYNVDTRRHLEERLEASRLEKQTQDYEYDYDFDLD
jgi:hypothetical protein